MINIDEKFNAVFDEIESEYDELVELTGSVEVMSDHKLYNFYLSKLKQVEHIAKLMINEGGAPLLAVEINCGSKEGAMQACLKFKDNPEKFYQELINLLS